MISVVTPTYNRKEMLVETISSVLQQTYNDIEIIIVDDYSTDGTEEFLKAEFAEERRIRYFKNSKNMGPGYNRNFGYRVSRGDYVVFIDDDDYYTDDQFFEKCMEIFREYQSSNLAMVAANAYDLYIETGRKEKEDIGVLGYIDGVKFLTNLEIKYHKPLSTFSAIFDRKVLQRAAFDEMKMVNDYAIYLRALLYGGAYILPDFVGCYRKHESNISLRIKRDFLIDNLEERKWVKDRLPGLASKHDITHWWNVQMRILFTYYIAITKPSLKDGLGVTCWIFRNSGFNPALWLMITFRFIKIKIKAFLGLEDVRRKVRKYLSKGVR